MNLARDREEVLHLLTEFVSHGEDPFPALLSRSSEDGEMLLSLRLYLPEILSAYVARQRRLPAELRDASIGLLNALPQDPLTHDPMSARDYAVVRLLRHVGFGEGISFAGELAPPAHDCPLATLSAWLEALSPLAHRGLRDSSTIIFLDQSDRIARATCLELMLNRPLSAARLLRWWAMIPLSGRDAELRDTFVAQVARYARSGPEIAFQIAIINRYHE